jgi:hypothetical protein
MFAPKIAKPQTKAAEASNSLARARSTLAAHRQGPVEQVLMLQRTIGNQATLRLLSQQTLGLTGNKLCVDHGREVNSENMMAREVPRGVSWDFSKIPIFPPDGAHRLEARSSLSAQHLPGTIQPKLVVGEVNDEADRIADGRGSTVTATIDEHEEGVITETQLLPGSPPFATPKDGCYIESAGFANIPSGAVSATLSGAKLGAAFTMIGDFAPRIPCDCSCGEYRQYIRGTFTANGRSLTHSLGGGRTLHPTTFQEDGDVAAGTAYGHRSSLGTKSKFTPDQMGGCRFEGADEPGVSGGSGARLAMNLDFRADLIDTCRSNMMLASSSWNVSGSATVP